MYKYASTLPVLRRSTSKQTWTKGVGNHHCLCGVGPERDVTGGTSTGHANKYALHVCIHRVASHIDIGEDNQTWRPLLTVVIP